MGTKEVRAGKTVKGSTTGSTLLALSWMVVI
jgi:hypothetical protein